MPLIEISNAPHLSAVDLWLHTTSSTVTKKIEVAIDGPFNYGVTQTLCHSDPYPPIYSNPFDPVLQILRLLNFVPCHHVASTLLWQKSKGMRWRFT